MTEIKNFSENKYVSVLVEERLPYKEGQFYVNKSERIRYIHLLMNVYKDHLIKALNARMDACISNLRVHKNSIVSNDGTMIVYKRKNGTFHSFNMPSYWTMQETVKALEENRFRDILVNKAPVDQLLKALQWQLHPVDMENTCFEDLISALFEILTIGPLEK